jgi:hypothetical protein
MRISSSEIEPFLTEDFLTGAVERAFPAEELLRATVERDLAEDFGLADFWVGTVPGSGLSDLATPFPFCKSVTGAAGLFSKAGGSLVFFEIFAIYFSFTSASLYARRKAAQAEIGTKAVPAKAIEGCDILFFDGQLRRWP